MAVHKKILLFDDEETIRMLYALELSEDGYEVITSGNVSECLEMIRENNPDVVVMDKKVGNQDGLEILYKIRGHFPALPLVLCTAYPRHDLDENSGFVVFHATKTWDLKDLREKINAAIASEVER